MLGKTPISGLIGGMTFAQDVVDTQGRTLIARGTDVTQKHIRILKTWGIEHVLVTPPETPPDSTTSDGNAETVFRQELQQMLDQRFALADREHPAVNAIYNICLQHALKRIGSKSSGRG